jgi:NAD(P)-dependent dehydrogenase (short-subunit alcohol dehydrogenase family)
MFELHHKVALVTGAGSGIGRAIALLFARQGARVGVVDIQQEQAESTVKEIESAGGNAFALPCDVSDSANVKQVIGSLPQIDILVNSAGISHIGRADTTSEADFDRVYRVNVKGVFNCMQAALPALRRQGGVILNLASVAATLGLSDRFAYSMSKGAVLSMTLSVAKDYLADKVRCNCISPGRVHTPFVDNFLAKNCRPRALSLQR